MPSFFGQEKYVIHYENLKLYLRLGLKLKKIHRVLEFNQSQWLKQYVDFNTQKRIEAEKDEDRDEKALYKLMNNSVYGKAIENLRNRIDVRLVSNKKDYLKWTSKPRVANEEFVGLKPKMYLYLVDDNSEHKKAKGVNKDVVATISHNEYKDILLNKKCLRYSMNRIQSKDHKTGT